MPQLDLNRLRETILENQQKNSALPARRDEKIYATPEGRIVSGESARPEQERRLSEVHQGVFASLATRLQRDREIVIDKFPANTKPMTVDGVNGWLYSIVDEFGQSYQLFAYHDGSVYQVQVVFPEVEGQYSPHNGHLYSDGTICFGDEHGLPTLEQAYAKSVVWANGFTVFLRTGKFPFSRNNQ
jgi:hypothetical protein